MRMEVTDIVQKWMGGTLVNEGLMVKRSGSVGNTDSGSDEGSTVRFGNFSFFNSFIGNTSIEKSIIGNRCI